MVILVVEKKSLKFSFPGKTSFNIFYCFTVSNKMTMTPMFFEQIKKFKCLKSFTTEGPEDISDTCGSKKDHMIDLMYIHRSVMPCGQFAILVAPL